MGANGSGAVITASPTHALIDRFLSRAISPARTAKAKEAATKAMLTIQVMPIGYCEGGPPSNQATVIINYPWKQASTHSRIGTDGDTRTKHGRLGGPI
jgi:hypothetical protein